MSQIFLSTLYDFFRRYTKGNEENFFEKLFPQYLATHLIAHITSLANRVLTGTRLPPRTISIFYADPDSPRRPKRLYDDALFFLHAVCAVESECKALYALLQTYAEDLPQLDNAEILAEHTDACAEAPLSIKAADLLTRLLWHALCWDAATR